MLPPPPADAAGRSTIAVATAARKLATALDADIPLLREKLVAARDADRAACARAGGRHVEEDLVHVLVRDRIFHPAAERLCPRHRGARGGNARVRHRAVELMVAEDADIDVAAVVPVRADARVRSAECTRHERQSGEHGEEREPRHPARALLPATGEARTAGPAGAR